MSLIGFLSFFFRSDPLRLWVALKGILSILLSPLQLIFGEFVPLDIGKVILIKRFIQTINFAISVLMIVSTFLTILKSFIDFKTIIVENNLYKMLLIALILYTLFIYNFVNECNYLVLILSVYLSVPYNSFDLFPYKNQYYQIIFVSLPLFLMMDTNVNKKFFRTIFYTSILLMWLPGVFLYNFNTNEATIDDKIYDNHSKIWLTVLLGLSIFYRVNGKYYKNMSYSGCLIILLWVGLDFSKEKFSVILLVIAISKHCLDYLLNGVPSETLMLLKIMISSIIPLRFCCKYSGSLYRSEGGIFVLKSEDLTKNCSSEFINNSLINNVDLKELYCSEMMFKIMLKEGDYYLVKYEGLLQHELKLTELETKIIIHSVEQKSNFAFKTLNGEYFNFYHCFEIMEALCLGLHNFDLQNETNKINIIGSKQLNINLKLKNVNPLFVFYVFRFLGSKNISEVIDLLTMSYGKVKLRDVMGNSKSKRFVSDCLSIKDIGFKIKQFEKLKTQSRTLLDCMSEMGDIEVSYSGKMCSFIDGENFYKEKESYNIGEMSIKEIIEAAENKGSSSTSNVVSQVEKVKVKEILDEPRFIEIIDEKNSMKVYNCSISLKFYNPEEVNYLKFDAVEDTDSGRLSVEPAKPRCIRRIKNVKPLRKVKLNRRKKEEFSETEIKDNFWLLGGEDLKSKIKRTGSKRKESEFSITLSIFFKKELRNVKKRKMEYKKGSNKTLTINQDTAPIDAKIFIEEYMNSAKRLVNGGFETIDRKSLDLEIDNTRRILNDFYSRMYLVKNIRFIKDKIIESNFLNKKLKSKEGRSNNITEISEQNLMDYKQKTVFMVNNIMKEMNFGLDFEMCPDKKQLVSMSKNYKRVIFKIEKTGNNGFMKEKGELVKEIYLDKSLTKNKDYSAFKKLISEKKTPLKKGKNSKNRIKRNSRFPSFVNSEENIRRIFIWSVVEKSQKKFMSNCFKEYPKIKNFKMFPRKTWNKIQSITSNFRENYGKNKDNLFKDTKVYEFFEGREDLKEKGINSLGRILIEMDTDSKTDLESFIEKMVPGLMNN